METVADRLNVVVYLLVGILALSSLALILSGYAVALVLEVRRRVADLERFVMPPPRVAVSHPSLPELRPVVDDRASVEPRVSPPPGMPVEPRGLVLPRMPTKRRGR